MVLHALAGLGMDDAQDQDSAAAVQSASAGVGSAASAVQSASAGVQRQK